MNLIYNYKTKSQNTSYEQFWQNDKDEFNNNDETHVLYMVKNVKMALNLDEYATKRLEGCIKTELPFFAKTRNITKNWLINNFYM